MDFKKLLPGDWHLTPEDDDRINEVFDSLRAKYKDYKDPWGFNIDTCEKAIRNLLPVYRNYFKVRVFGQENLQDQPYIVVSNHSGQIAIDGMLIGIAFMIDVASPKVLRAMVERFLSQLPFLGDYSAQVGAVLGDRANCQFLLDHGESILVFPEGVRGVSKSTANYYQLQSFTNGFYRIALQNQTDILPVAVIGAEEMFPFVYQAKGLAKFFKLPAVPLTTNIIPLPSPIDIYIGKGIPVSKELSVEAPDRLVRQEVSKIENEIKKMIKAGLKEQRPFLDQIRKPINKLIRKKETAK